MFGLNLGIVATANAYDWELSTHGCVVETAYLIDIDTNSDIPSEIVFGASGAPKSIIITRKLCEFSEYYTEGARLCDSRSDAQNPTEVVLTPNFQIGDFDLDWRPSSPVMSPKVYQSHNGILYLLENGRITITHMTSRLSSGTDAVSIINASCAPIG